jgi:hypothetical protein
LAIAKDASSPATGFTVQGSAATSWTTAAFSPPANSLVGVLAMVGYGVAGGSSPACTCKDGNNVTYTAGPAVFDTAFAWEGIFTHFYASAPGSITIVVSRTGTTQAGVLLFPIVLTGCASSQAGAASTTNTSSSTSLISSITTTTTGSWALVAGGAGSAESSMTHNGGTSDQQVWVADNTTDQVAGAAGSAVTGTPGATSLGWTLSPTGTDWAWAALEILPSAGGGTTPSDTESAKAADAASIKATLSGLDVSSAADAASIKATLGTPETFRMQEGQSVSTPSAPFSADTVQATESREFAAGPRKDTDAAQATDDAVSPAPAVPRLYSIIRTYAR